jgi:hypothetical protein
VSATGSPLELRSDGLQKAMLGRADAAAIAPLLAEDVVLHSPILAAPFEGREVVANLLSVVNGIVDDMRYTHRMTDGSAEVLVALERIRGVELQSTLVIEFDDHGLARAIDVFFRPFHAMATFMAVASAQLALTPGRGRLLRALSAPLPTLARSVDAAARRNLRLR